MELKGADGVRKALEEIAKKMGAGKLAVGFGEEATYPDGTPVAAVAFWDEFGHGGTPPRPFFRPMIAAEGKGWPKKMAALAKVYEYDGSKVLAAMGEDIGGALRKSIIDTNSPALSPVTLMLRKMVGNQPEKITGAMVGEAARRVAEGETGATGTQAKPLVWTSHMLNSVSYSVNDGAAVKIAKGE